MSRRSSPTKREILPDPVYNSVTITKFINVLMERGKKSTAERILYGALEIVAKKSGEEAIEAFQKAINNITNNTVVIAGNGPDYVEALKAFATSTAPLEIEAS